MELILVEPNSPEWDYMWKFIAEHPINKDIPEPTTAFNNGESWQYMGSYMEGKRVVHAFRHRCHPVGDSLRTCNVAASEGFNDSQIYSKFKL